MANKKMMQKTLCCMSTAILAVWMLSGCGYNRLQQMEEDVFKAWTHLESGFTHRMELIPPLAAVVRESPGHEETALDRLVNAHAWAASGAISVEELENRDAMDNLRKSQDTLSAAISHLLAKVAADPALENDSSWLALNKRLEKIENQILAATHGYNRKVDQFNAAIRKFPDNLTNSFFLELEPKLHYEGHTQRLP